LIRVPNNGYPCLNPRPLFFDNHTVTAVTMNEPRIVHCPQCSRPFKSLRGLAQHISRRTACAALARPLLEGATDLYEDPHFPPSADYKDTVNLNDEPADAAMTPVWQEVGEGGPTNSLMDSWRYQQSKHVHTETYLAEAEASVDEAVHHHLEQSSLTDSATMADVGNHPQDKSFEDDVFQGYEDVTADDVILNECNLSGPDVADATDAGSSPFYDRMHGKYTNEEMLSLRLLKLLRALKTPNYAYRKIMNLFADAAQANVSLSSTFRSREAAIKHFGKRFGLESLAPMTLTKHLKDRSYPVVQHDCEVMIKSILFSSLMVEENMLFSDPNNPLAPPPLVSATLGDIVTGDAYGRAHRRLCTEPNHMLCPLILYLDKVTIDRH
jgi:hypothetical protein